MRHRDRVLTALHHEEPDRCPMDISFTPEFADRLREQMGLEEDPCAPEDGSSYVLERALGLDMLYSSVGFAKARHIPGVEREVEETFADEWGVEYSVIEYDTRFGRGRYTEIVGSPLADDAAIDPYRPPDPDRPELYAQSEQVVKAFKNEYWITGGTPLTILETAFALRGRERLLMDLALGSCLLERVLDIPYRYHLVAARKLVELGVDMLRLADDVGAQNAMMISPHTWRRFLKPRMATFIQTLKRMNPNLVIAYHSDGLIYPIIGDLIEIGVDVLNPVQPRCMDPAKLKEKYGDRLCFWGSIDVQYTLPYGSPADVREEVLTRLRTIGKNGGLIIGPAHMVQLDTPLDNFWAMVNTVMNTPYSSLQSNVSHTVAHR
jgi:uroporphyrinogen decarboxylase